MQLPVPSAPSLVFCTQRSTQLVANCFVTRYDAGCGSLDTSTSAAWAPMPHFCSTVRLDSVALHSRRAQMIPLLQHSTRLLGRDRFSSSSYCTPSFPRQYTSSQVCFHTNNSALNFQHYQPVNNSSRLPQSRKRLHRCEGENPHAKYVAGSACPTGDVVVLVLHALMASSLELSSHVGVCRWARCRTITSTKPSTASDTIPNSSKSSFTHFSKHSPSSPSPPVPVTCSSSFWRPLLQFFSFLQPSVVFPPGVFSRACGILPPSQNALASSLRW